MPDIKKAYVNEEHLDEMMARARSAALKVVESMPDEQRDDCLVESIADNVVRSQLSERIGVEVLSIRPLRHPFIARIAMFPLALIAIMASIRNTYGKVLLSGLIVAICASEGWLGSSPLEVASLSILSFAVLLYCLAFDVIKEAENDN